MIRVSVRRLATRLLSYLIPCFVIFSTACGVSFGGGSDEGTEVFKSIRLTGERRAGAELTVTVGITRVYPVPVRLACFYETNEELTDDQYKMTFEERAAKIGETVLEPVPGRRPDDEDVPREEISFRFSVPEPGSYFLACNTPAAAENGTGLSFKIE
jgi:hypothetical protein